MFEALISAFLESSLGQFVCLDKDQLKVGMWGGNLELQNLKIKITILDDLFTELESPAAFTLVKGVVGTLNLSFNWAKLNSVPVRIALSDIHILVRPQWGAGGWTEEQTQAFVQSRKQRLLESANRRFQERLKKAIEQHAALGEGKKPKVGWTATLVANIVDNIEVSIDRVHLVVEGSIRKRSFCFGLYMARFAFASTDSQGKPLFAHSTGTYMYKKVDISQLGAYWNHRRRLFKWDNDKHFCQLMSRIFLPARANAFQHMLQPVDASLIARLRKKKCTDGVNTPKLTAAISLRELALVLSSRQYRDINTMLGEWDRFNYFAVHAASAEYSRPPTTPRPDARAWWRYAGSVVRGRVRKHLQAWSWEYMHRACTHRKRYVDLYLAKLSSDAVERETMELQHFEDQWHESVVLAWRTLAEDKFQVGTFRAELLKKRSANSAGSIVPGFNLVKSMGSGALGYLPFNPLASIYGDDETSKILTDDEENELKRILGYDEERKIEDEEQGEQLLKLKFRLDKSSVTLVQSDRKCDTNAFGTPFLRASLQNLAIKASQDKVLRLSVALQGMFFDRLNKSKQFEPFICPQGQLSLVSRLGQRGRSSSTGLDLPNLPNMDYEEYEEMEEFLDEEDDVSESSGEGDDEDDELGEFDDEADMWETESTEGEEDEEYIDFFDGEDEEEAGEDLFRLEYSCQESRKDGESAEAVLLSNKSRTPDLTLSVVMKPLDVFYSKRLMSTLSSFFKLAKQEPSMVIQELEIAAQNALQELKAETQAKLDYALQHHINMHLEFDIQTPSIYIKSSDSFLVLNLGQVTIATGRRAGAGVSGEEAGGVGGPTEDHKVPEPPSMDAFYDVFQLRISDVEVQLVPVDALEHWRETQARASDGIGSVTDKDYRLVEKFTVNMNIMPSVLPSDTSVTRMRIEGELEEVHIWLSTNKYRRIEAILEDLQTAEADFEEDVGKEHDAFGGPGTPRGSIGSQSTPITPQGSLPSTPQFKSRRVSTDTMEVFGEMPSFDELDFPSSQMTLPSESRSARMALPPSWVMLDVSVGAPLLCVHLSVDGKKGSKSNMHPQGPQNDVVELVRLTVQDVAVRLVLHPYDSVVDFQVGMLELEDSRNKDSQFRYLISSQPADLHGSATTRKSRHPPAAGSEMDEDQDGTEHLIHVRYRGVGAFPDSAPLAYASRPTGLELEFSTLQVNWNRTTLSLLMDNFKSRTSSAPVPPTPINVRRLPSQHKKHLRQRSKGGGDSPLPTSRSSSDLPLTPNVKAMPGTPILAKRHLRRSSKASNYGSPPHSPAPPPPYSPAPPHSAFKEVSAVPDAFSVVPILNMKIDRIERQAEDRKTSGRRSAASQEESPHATLHIVAKLKMFTISLNDDLGNFSVARFGYSGLEIDVTTSAHRTTVTGALDNLTIHDPPRLPGAPPSIRPSLMFSKRQEKDSSLISFSYDEGLQDNVSELDVRIASAEWVISNDFISRVMAYFQEGLIKEVTEQGAAKARKAIEELNEEARRKCALFSYSLTAESPLLVLPHNSEHADDKPPECLVLDLGKISIANHFFISEHEHELIGKFLVGEEPVTSRVPMEAITVTVSALNLLRTDLTERAMHHTIQDSCSKMLEDATISMRVRQPMADVQAKGLPSMDLESDVLTIHVSLSQEECGYLLTAWAMDLEPLLLTLDGPNTGKSEELESSIDLEDPKQEKQEEEEEQLLATPLEDAAAQFAEEVGAVEPHGGDEEGNEADAYDGDASIKPVAPTFTDEMVATSISFHIREFVLDLTSNGTDGDSEAPEPAYRISVKTLALLLEKRSNGTSLLDVGLGSLSLQDTRPDCPHSMYSQIIGGHTQQEEGTGGLREEELEAEEGQRASWWSLQKERKRLQPRSFSERSDEENNESTILPDLRVRVATQPLDGFDDMRLDVDFTSPRVVVSADIIAAMLDFADRTMAITQAAMNGMPKRAQDSPVAAAHVDAEEAIPLVSQTRLQVCLNLQDPQIWVLGLLDEDPHDEEDDEEHDNPLFHPLFTSVAATVASATETAISVNRRQTSDDQGIRVRSMSFESHSPRLSATCLVFRANVSLLFQSTSGNEDLLLNVSADQMQSLVCYRAKHLFLSRLKPPPAPVFEPLNISIEYKRSRPPPHVSPRESQASPLSSPAEGEDDVEVKTKSVEAQESDKEEPMVQDLEITLSELNAYFSFLQISSAMTIIDSITSVVAAAMPQSGPKNSASEATPAATSSDEAKLKAAALCLDKSDEQGNAQSSALFAAFQAFTGRAQVRTHGVQLAIVNDAPGYYVPLVSFSMPQLAFNLSGREGLSPLQGAKTSPEQSSKFTLDVALAINYFNQQLMTWEPAFENWSFQVAGNTFKITLTSAEILNLNLTSACVDTLVKGLECFRAQFLPSPHTDEPLTPHSPSTSALNSRRKASYFLVRNLTGTRIRFCSVTVDKNGVSEADPSSDLAGKVKVLEDGEERPLELQQWHGAGAGAGMLEGRTWLYRTPAVGLQVEAGSNTGRWNVWKSIRQVELVALTGSDDQSASPHPHFSIHPLELDPGHGSRRTLPQWGSFSTSPSSITCRVVSLPDSTSAKVLEVSSSVFCKNRTFVPMELRLVDEQGIPLFAQRVLPGDSVALPVTFTDPRYIKLSIKPVGTSHEGMVWDWSNPFRLVNIDDPAFKHTLVKCTPTLQNLLFGRSQLGVENSIKCFSCRLNLSQTGEHAGAGTLRTIALDPPLALHNVLSRGFYYQIQLKQSVSESFRDCSLDTMKMVHSMTGYLGPGRELQRHNMDLGISSLTAVTIQLRFSCPSRDRDETEEASDSLIADVKQEEAAGWRQRWCEQFCRMWSEEWSEAAVIHSTVTNVVCSPLIRVQDSFGETVSLLIDFSSPTLASLEPGAITSEPLDESFPFAGVGPGVVFVYTPYWFVNHSGLPLLYAARVGAKEQEAAGQIRDPKATHTWHTHH